MNAKRVIYNAIPKIGSRHKVWLICNEHGGLVKEFDGTQAEAYAEVAAMEQRSAAALAEVR